MTAYTDRLCKAMACKVGVMQVTSEPTLAPLLSELIHSTEGQEVRLREPADYHIHDLKKTTFAEVAENARTKAETAIGYVLRLTWLVCMAWGWDTVCAKLVQFCNLADICADFCTNTQNR